MDPAKLRAEAEKELEQARIHMKRAHVLQTAARELEEAGSSRAGKNDAAEAPVPPALPVRELDFVGAMRAKGFTYESLARELGVSKSTLSTHRLDKSSPNSRPIPESRAKNVERLIGWPAVQAAWPAEIRAGR